MKHFLDSIFKVNFCDEINSKVENAISKLENKVPLITHKKVST